MAETGKGKGDGTRSSTSEALQQLVTQQQQLFLNVMAQQRTWEQNLLQQHRNDMERLITNGAYDPDNELWRWFVKRCKEEEPWAF